MTATTIDQAAGDSAPAPLPWKRQANETAAHFKLFQAFLAQGFARDLETTATETKRSYDHVRKVARDNAWDDRAEAYDEHRLEGLADRWIEKTLRAFDQDEQLLRVARLKAAEGLKNLNVKEQKAGDVARMVDVVLRQSRLLYGDPYKMFAAVDPGEGDEVGGGGGEEAARFAAMPKEERDRVLKELQRVLAGRAHARSGRDDE